MAQQIGLFGAAPRVFCDDDRGRIVYYPAVFSPEEAQRLFALFESTLSWSHETMWMYDKTVDVPRLIARFPEDTERPRELLEVQSRIEAFLQERFTSISLQLYRGCNDSVSWHNDHREELIELPTIALLSLGATREMQLRTKRLPRESYGIDLEAGSLMVMSGRAQEFWEHTIPKCKRPVGVRISVALRQRRISA